MKRTPSQSQVFTNGVEEVQVVSVSGEGDSLGLSSGKACPSNNILEGTEEGAEEKRSDPFWNRAVFILVVEAMERLTYYTLAMNLAHCEFQRSFQFFQKKLPQKFYRVDLL